MQSDDRCFDISFDRFKAEPMAVVDEIDRHFGLELMPETRSSMQRFHTANAAEEVPPHRYFLADWELDVEETRRRFAT